MRKISSIVLVVLSGMISSLSSFVGATNLHVTLPDAQWYQDVQRATNGQSEITSNSGDITSLIQLVNEYLRIAIGVVCMAVLVIGGIKLISARGDEAAMKKASNTMLSAVIGIAIAIFSYLIVRMALNLF